ncbi:molecular chaperone DjlA [Marinobacter sp.]|uniref:molecular chaperone DjlA n=1 Tax=Marinobacter sp. TaxID=50741 RepID=UPI00384C04DD
MTPVTGEPALSARLEIRFYDLLEELGASGHRPDKMITPGRLPRWCRRSLFYFLGYIARAEGRVSPADISFAEALMKSLTLTPRQRKRAIEQFRLGKETENPSSLRGLGVRTIAGLRPSPALHMLFCLAHAAQLHGRPGKARKHRCEDAVDLIGLPLRLLQEILDSYSRKVWQSRAELQPLPDSYEQACKLLGVSTREKFEKTKQAYRRRVSECHPDKLDRDLGEADLAVAKERLLRYQKAWELVKRRHARR